VCGKSEILNDRGQVSKTLGRPNLPIDMGLTRIGRLALAIVRQCLIFLAAGNCGSHYCVHLATIA